MALERVAQGGTIVLSGEYLTGDGDLFSPSAPRVDIIDPNGNQLVSDDIPNLVSLGNYSYAYLVPVGASLGVWRIHWTGVVEGASAGGDEWFQVVTPGSIASTPSPASGPCQPFVGQIDLCCVVSGGFEDPCLTSGHPIPQSTVDLGLQSASELLWAMTGRQFGLCTVTIRPCRASCDPCGDGTADYFDVTDFSYGSGFPWTPHNENGVWTNVKCECSGGCSCTTICEVPLPYPVNEVLQVLIDGEVADPTTYRIDNFKTLVRVGVDENGNGLCWPRCQDLTKPPTEVGTWSVTLTYGRPVPALVQQATASLACEMIKACAGQPCALPQRMQSMTRQGVTVGFLDQQSFFAEGLTGIYLVDLAIKTFNPRGLLKQASVYSVDSSPRWRHTG